MSNDRYVYLGYDYIRRKAYDLGLDEEMLRRIDLSKDAVTANLDRTSGRRLLDGVHKKLRKYMHPDIRKDVDHVTATNEFSAMENVYSGVIRLISKQTPDRDFFVTLGVHEPNNINLRSNTSRSAPNNSASWAQASGNFPSIFDPEKIKRTNQYIARYRKMRNLGFAAAGLATVGAAGIGLLPFTAFYELASSTVTGQPLNLGLLRTVADLYLTTATVGTVASYAAVGVDFCRGEYSEVRRTVRQVYNDIRYG